MTEGPRKERVDREYGERRDGGSGGSSAPRRVGDVREERERGGETE